MPKKAVAKTIHNIIKQNPIDFFSLSEIQAIIAAFLIGSVVFPPIPDQGDQRNQDIYISAGLIGTFLIGNFTAELIAHKKNKKLLQHVLRRFREDLIDISVIMNFMKELAELLDKLPSEQKNSFDNAIISVSDWLTNLGYYQAAILSSAVLAKLSVGVLLARSQKKWATNVSHVGQVIVDSISLYNFSSLFLTILQDFNPAIVTAKLIFGLPIGMAVSAIVFESFPDFAEYKNNKITASLGRVHRGYSSLVLLAKLGGISFMMINNVISFIANKMKDLEYPNAIAFALLNTSMLFSLNLAYLVFRLKSAKNESADFKFPEKFAQNFIYEFSKALFWREALVGTATWTITFPIMSAMLVSFFREKNWRMLNSMNSYLFDAGLIVALGLEKFGAAAIAPVGVGVFLLEAGIDLFKLKKHYFWLNAAINFTRTGLTSFVFANSMPVPYLPYVVTPVFLAMNAAEILAQKESPERIALLSDSTFFDDMEETTNNHKIKLSPAHIALTIFMVLFLSVREAFSEENSKGSWAAQLLLLATLIPLAIRLAAALMPKKYNNVCGFFGIPKIPLPCLNSNNIETPQLNW